MLAKEHGIHVLLIAIPLIKEYPIGQIQGVVESAGMTSVDWRKIEALGC